VRTATTTSSFAIRSTDRERERRRQSGRGAARRGFRAVVAVLLLAAGVGGCTRFVLNQLDWVAVWYVNGYVTLDDRQKALVRDSVRRNVTVFRTEQLPGFLDVLGGMRGDLGATMTPALVAQRFGEIETLGRQTAGLLVPDTVLLLRSLSPAQVDELFATFAENAEELAEDYSGSTPERRRERQARSVLKMTRRMTGSLTPAQEQLMRDHLARLHDLAPQWLERRRNWQQALRAALDGAREAPEFDQRVASLILDPDQFDSVRYRAKVGENRIVIYEMLAALMQSLSPVQRAHVDRRLAEYERNLLALTAG
jgi:hypothetical protein